MRKVMSAERPQPSSPAARDIREANRRRSSSRTETVQRGDGDFMNRFAFEAAVSMRSAMACSEMVLSSPASLVALARSMKTPAGFPGALNLMPHVP
jgi:hypothetical protein